MKYSQLKSTSQDPPYAVSAGPSATPKKFAPIHRHAGNAPAPMMVTQCTNPPKCPTCRKRNHEAGSAACAIFANRQKIIKFAYENNMSVTEAGRLHSGASLSNTKDPGSTQHPPSEENHTRQEIDDLKTKVDELQRIITSRDIPRVVEERLEISSPKSPQLRLN